MTRFATHEDVPALLRLAHMLHGQSTFFHMQFSPEVTAVTLLGLIDSEHGAVLVAEEDGEIVGALPCQISRSIFSHETVASELAIFVRPGEQGRGAGFGLVRRFVEWARDHGASRIEVGNSAGMDDDTYVAIMRRFGFRRAGSLMYQEV